MTKMTAKLSKSLPIVALSVTAFTATLGLSGCNNATALENATVVQTSKTIPTAIAQTNSQYANQRFLTINNQNMPISETSARLLTTPTGNAPALVSDIYAGKANVAVPGYKIMVINRTSSLAAEGRVRDGKIIDNRMIHRGSKSLIGIPVVNNQPQLNRAVLLDFDVIYDDPNQPLAEGEVVKPRGEKLTKNDVPVTNKQVRVQSLTLPNFASGENAGGGIVFEASATVNGQPIKTGANSAFQIFDTATPDNARGFGLD
ncbi:hypothetical protein [Psychrobacter sp. I-STPA10]|uniref:hypothetical protein n=1 Tax=Psychrobacter sp. I-STPA10 TaxID=2585769 RepID=UPI001E44A82E|nr:hypothetical protein [Psychrobacter sp. I-STPA10]